MNLSVLDYEIDVDRDHFVVNGCGEQSYECQLAKECATALTNVVLSSL